MGGGLFTMLRNKIDQNAKRAVEAYTTELPDYRAVAANPAGQAGMLDFAVLLRRRETELAEINQPLTNADLGVLRAYGEERGAAGISLVAQQRVLVLHSVLTLREIQEAAGPNDSDHIMHVLGWLPENGLAAQTAYTEGYLLGQKRFLPVTQRVQSFARTLLADNPAVSRVAASLNMPLADRYVVIVVRVPQEPFGSDRRDEIVDELIRQRRTPITWQDWNEFIALVPAPADAQPLVQEFAQLLGRPCAVGAATGYLHHLADALTLARRVSQAAPVQVKPQLHELSDVFVELGVGHVPEVDTWLRDLARRLMAGPDLVTTLDTFYQHGMNRLHTAGALHIHPRTLDYRLRRVRELVGLDPTSVRGVRALSTTITLILAGTWQ